MSVQTHTVPTRVQGFEASPAPSLIDWAVVAKVSRFSPENAAKAGAMLMESMAETQFHERLLGVKTDERGISDFTYSLPNYPSPGTGPIVEAVSRAINLTEDGMAMVTSPLGLIVAVRMAHWRDVTEIDQQTGERIFDPAWERLTTDSGHLAEGILEARGHGLANLHAA